MTSRWIIIALFFFGVICLFLYLTDPLPQDPAYHLFADQRTLLGIPHFWNVVSNLPYLLVGIAACYELIRKKPRGYLPALHINYLVMFLGVMLVGPGSSWYHLHPSNQSLLWDRLPMAITFMAFASIIVGEYLHVRSGRLLLWPLVLVGIASVVYWHVTELYGRGDLRPYAIVQFLPMLLIPLLMLQRPGPYIKNTWAWWLMGCYLLAKVFEQADAAIYSIPGLISGHSIKHLVSAAGVLVFLVGLYRRKLQPDLQVKIQ